MCTSSTSERQKRLKTFSSSYFWLGNVLRTTTAYTFSTSERQKVVRIPSVFYTFDLEMCFAPQWRALFRHVNFQKWSDVGVLCAFWLGNVLRTTTACNFSSLRWPGGSAPAALASLPRATNHWKNAVNRDFPTFSRTCIFFLPTLSLLCSSHFLASPLWLFPPLLFHLSILLEVWLLNFLRLWFIYLFIFSFIYLFIYLFINLITDILSI